MTNQPIKILFTIPNFITAGSGGAMLNIIQRLDRNTFAPAVCVLKKGGILERVIAEMGIPYLEAPFTVPARPYTSLYSRARNAAGAFKDHGFQLWHSFHYLDDYSEAIIAKLAGVSSWIYTKKNMNWDRRAWHLRSILAARILAQNTDMFNDFFNRRWYRDKTRLVPRGVDTEIFRPGAPLRSGLRAKLGIPADSALVGCVAHLVPVKGHSTLLEALAGSAGAHLLLAGKPLDAGYAASLKELSRELKISERVHFLGGVADVPALLGELDVFVLPTWARWRMEGCPVALLEAMSCGVACVASDIPGARDLIEHLRCGLLVPPEDPAALRSALQNLLASPERRTEFGASARQRVLAKYSIEAEVARHEAVYLELCRTP